MSPALQVRMHWAYLAVPVGAGLALWHLLAHWVSAGIAAHPLDKMEEQA
jgi:TRAP-type C4-dicarboxylate transport system permease small subunit